MVMELLAEFKQYDWGKFGDESMVARYARLNNPNLVINPTAPYAELLIGDHPDGSSKIKANGMKLSDFLKTEDGKETNNGCDRLSYLFRVMSVRKALTVEMHPNKKEMEKLHAEKPEIYTDDNHKPEIAIALTPFTVLMGFQPPINIDWNLTMFSPLTRLVKMESVNEHIGVYTKIKACFANLMRAPQDEVTACITNIAENFTQQLIREEYYDLFTTLNNDYPNDVGILCLFFFNVLKLKPGEACFAIDKEPHCYLYGDCLECSAVSNTVVRAGLTSEYRDVDALLEYVDYKSMRWEAKYFSAVRQDDYFGLFVPDSTDFCIARLVIPAAKLTYVFRTNQYGSCIIAFSGKKLLKTIKGELVLRRGSIAYIPGNVGLSIEFHSVSDSTVEFDEDFVAYIAMYNSYMYLFNC